MDRYAPIMPADVRASFERYIKHPAGTPADERRQLRTYIALYGRLKVLNAVPESRSDHLNALMTE